MKIIVSEEIESVCPTFVGACVEAKVENTPYSKELWDEINSLGEKYKETLTTESLKDKRNCSNPKSLSCLWQRPIPLPSGFRSPYPKNAAGQGTLSKRYAGGFGQLGEYRIRL